MKQICIPLETDQPLTADSLPAIATKINDTVIGKTVQALAPVVSNGNTIGYVAIVE